LIPADAARICPRLVVEAAGDGWMGWARSDSGWHPAETWYTARLIGPSRPRGNTENTMVKIRLTRGGAKKRPFYHIIVTDQRNKRDGRAIERVGFYNPVAQGNEQRVQINTDRVQHWVGVGAQMTEKVDQLYRDAVKAAAQAA